MLEPRSKPHRGWQRSWPVNWVAMRRGLPRRSSISRRSLEDTSGPERVTTDLLRSLAWEHAPIVQLHPEDRFRPTSPVAFVGDSRLRMYDRRQQAHMPLHPVLNLRTRKWTNPPAVRALKVQASPKVGRVAIHSSPEVRRSPRRSNVPELGRRNLHPHA